MTFRVDPKQINFIDLRRYAESHGWRLRTRWLDRVLVYEHGDTSEVMKIPLESDFADYYELLADAIVRLAETEGRAAESVYRDVREAEFDIVRIRTMVHTSGEVYPNLAEGRSVLRGAYSAFRTLAQFVQRGPRPLYNGRLASKVAEYMNQLRLGHSEVGSFVYTLMSPVEVRFSTQEEMWNDDLPRKVTIAFEDTLVAMKAGVLEALASDSDDPLTNRIESGVSSNMLRAISDILAQDEEVAFSIEFSQRAKRSSRLGAGLTFPSGSREIIQSAAKSLGERATLNDIQVEGYVKQIDVTEPQERYGVKILALVDGRNRTVTAEFGREDWDVLSRAAGDDIPIKFIADLRRRDKYLEADNPVGLELGSN